MAYKEIPLSKDKVTIVDESDYSILIQWKWYYANSGYAGKSTHIPLGRGKRKIKCDLMHRIIMNCPKNMQVDHINMDKLDNRRLNLRICTRTENKGNIKSYKNSTSLFKGVSWDSSRKKWLAQMVKGGKKILMKRFSSEIEAALAYNEAAKKYFGEFARINEIHMDNL